MALNDIYRVTLVSIYNVTGPAMLNKLYYKQVSEVPIETGAGSLANRINEVIVAAMLNVLNLTTHLVGLNVENIVPGIDNSFNSYGPTARPGARAGTAHPPYVCWAFRLNRVSTASRNGQKRFGAISMEDTALGLATGTVVPLLNTLASQLGAVLGTPPNQSLFEPRIFRRADPAHVPPIVQADFAIGEAVFVGVSSQNSRKFGRGD